MKTFRVEPGHDALHRGVWHGPGMRVMLEENEWLEIHTTLPDGKRAGRIGKYGYAQLDPTAPPPGLSRSDF